MFTISVIMVGILFFCLGVLVGLVISGVKILKQHNKEKFYSEHNEQLEDIQL